MYVTSVMTSGYYEWSIGRKRSAYEEMAKKKVALLEQVKETETFKVCPPEICSVRMDVTVQNGKGGRIYLAADFYKCPFHA